MRSRARPPSGHASTRSWSGSSASSDGSPRCRPGRSDGPGRTADRRTIVAMEVIPVPQLSDNYAYLVVDPSSGVAGVVDCAEAEPVLEEVKRRGVTLGAVL